MLRMAHLADNAERFSLFGREAMTEQAELFGRASAGDTGEAHRPQSSYQAFAHSRNAESGIGRRYAQIAGQRDLQAAAQAVALDGGDGDGVQCRQRAHALFPGGEPFAGQVAFCQLFGIEPAAKGAPLAADDHHVGLAALRQVMGCGHKVLYPGPVGGIERLGAIEPQARQVSVHFTAHRLKLKCLHAIQLLNYGVIAMARSGLPEPLTILSGAAITIAPVVGNRCRFIRLVRPNLPAPCMKVWLGKAGSNPPACPASVPTVSTPTPRMSRSFARNAEHDGWKPGECDKPSAWMPRNSSRPWCLLQPVRTSSHAADGSRPCSPSHCSTRSMVSRKSGFCCTSVVTSMTQAGPTNLRTGMVSVALLGKSLPVIQWMGASKCVPVCSPRFNTFQYQAGPRLS